MSICSVIDRLIRRFEENSLSYVCHNLCNVCAWNLIKHIGDAILCMISAICLHIVKIRFVLENFGFSIKTCIFFIIRKFKIHRWNQHKKWCDTITKHCRWIISYRTTVTTNLETRISSNLYSQCERKLGLSSLSLWIQTISAAITYDIMKPHIVKPNIWVMVPWPSIWPIKGERAVKPGENWWNMKEH